MDLRGTIEVGKFGDWKFGDSQVHRQYPDMYGKYMLGYGKYNEIYDQRIYKQMTNRNNPYFLVFCKKGR